MHKKRRVKPRRRRTVTANPSASRPKKRVRFLSRRRFFVAIAIVAQMAFLALLLAGGSLYFRAAGWALHVLSVVVSFYVYNKGSKPGLKLTWIFLILLFPLFGGMFYLVFHVQSDQRKYRRLLIRSANRTAPYFRLAPGQLASLKGKRCYRISRFLDNFAGYPIYTNTQTAYFPSGEAYYAELLPALRRAERYIFLESFIIQKSAMLGGILPILLEKASAGVDVRVMFDDLGCFATLPDNFVGIMNSMRIKCMVFNPFRPVLSSLQNNRDHRKIISIDGRTAFTGGVNIGDEYLNLTPVYGHWRDAAIRLTGDGAWSLTLIFLRLWNVEAYISRKYPTDDFAAFFPVVEERERVAAGGFVQPYADSPISKEYICEKVYLHLINSAQDYMYISTPYLILDEAVLSALLIAAKSGTDVRIITPHRGDKPLVQMVTRSFYRQLIHGGVRVYEYTAGFNHAKTFVCDDSMATVGTANLDFRSLYHDYECAVFLYNTPAVRAIKDDFVKTLASCVEIREEDCARNAFFRVTQDVARLFGPLM